MNNILKKHFKNQLDNGRYFNAMTVSISEILSSADEYNWEMVDFNEHDILASCLGLSPFSPVLKLRHKLNGVEMHIQISCSDRFACELTKLCRQAQVNGYTHTYIPPVLYTHKFKVLKISRFTVTCIGKCKWLACELFKVHSEAQLPIDWNDRLKRSIIECFDTALDVIDIGNINAFVAKEDIELLKEGHCNVWHLPLAINFIRD